MGRVFAGEAFVVKCDRCFAQYKLTPTPGQSPQRWLSCPSCAYEIDVAAQRPYESLAHHRIFGTDPILPTKTAPIHRRLDDEDSVPFWATSTSSTPTGLHPSMLASLVEQWPVIASVEPSQSLIVPTPPFAFEVMVRDFLFYEAQFQESKQNTKPKRPKTSLLGLTPPSAASLHVESTSSPLPLPPPLPESVTDALIEPHFSDELSSNALAVSGTRPMFAVEPDPSPPVIEPGPLARDDEASDIPEPSPVEVSEATAEPERVVSVIVADVSREDSAPSLLAEDVQVDDPSDGEQANDVRVNEEVTPITVAPPEVIEETIQSTLLPETGVEVETSAEGPEEVLKSPKRRWVVPAIVVLGVLIAFVAGVFAQRAWWTTPTPRSVEPVGSTSSAMRMASMTVHLAALRDTSSLGVRRAVARDLLAANRVNEAVKLLEWMWQVPSRRDIQTSALYAQALVSANRWHLARQVSLYGLTLSSKHPGLQRAFQKAVSNDPTLKLRTLTLGGEAGLIDDIRALGGGKSLSFKMKKGGRNVFAFKPRQQIWIEGWRAEIAADIFCDVMRCGFDVPRNRPARIAREDFERLYAKKKSNKQTAYQERFGELMFVREPDEQGKVRAYLYGTLKDWLPSFINWPLEYRQIWAPWLKQETSMAVLKGARLVDAIRPLRRIQSDRFYQGMLQERETLDVVSFADQISQLFVFDYLVTNWDRFSTVEAYYGANTHFARGRLISLDNGAAFHSQRMQVVDGLLPMVERFNRRQIAAIRALTPESLNHVLYPLADGDAKQRLRVFWGQRKRLLAHVDGLIAKYGEDAVLAF